MPASVGFAVDVYGGIATLNFRSVLARTVSAAEAVLYLAPVHKRRRRGLVGPPEEARSV